MGRGVTMSLQIDGAWRANTWAPTAWAAGVWREGDWEQPEPAPIWTVKEKVTATWTDIVIVKSVWTDK